MNQNKFLITKLQQRFIHFHRLPLDIRTKIWRMYYKTFIIEIIKRTLYMDTYIVSTINNSTNTVILWSVSNPENKTFFSVFYILDLCRNNNFRIIHGNH